MRFVTVSRQRWETVKRIIVGILIAIFSVALQTTVFSRIRLPFLSPAAPSLTLLSVIAAGFFLEERMGALMGLICGFLADAAVGETYMLLPVLYTLCGYLVGVLAKDRLAHNLPSFAVWVLIGGVWEQVTVYLRGMIAVRAFPPTEMITFDLLPSLMLTLLFSLPMYFFGKLLMKIFVRK